MEIYIFMAFLHKHNLSVGSGSAADNSFLGSIDMFSYQTEEAGG